jgi:hypothetical protein
MKCKANKLDGTRCRANSMNGSNYCFRHNKKVEGQAFQASSSGGKAKRQYHRLGEKMKLETPDDIKKLMAEAINSLWTGKMPASNPAGALGYLAKTFLEAYDKSDLEDRVEELEKRLDSLKK